ncbi:hypothetical protein, partial [Neisseria bacilliformis]|uniref:hypothetical protein n=1 Tax=Neisseria bacilliformis TaxID=267212 RepID=UPI003C735794
THYSVIPAQAGILADSDNCLFLQNYRPSKKIPACAGMTPAGDFAGRAVRHTNRVRRLGATHPTCNIGGCPRLRGDDVSEKTKSVFFRWPFMLKRPNIRRLKNRVRGCATHPTLTAEAV